MSNVKLGGLGLKLIGFTFFENDIPPSSHELEKAWRPYIEVCIEIFGPQRCMFESNFPVDKGTCSYQVLWNAFKRIGSSYSTEEKTALFSGTAAEGISRYCMRRRLRWFRSHTSKLADAMNLAVRSLSRGPSSTGDPLLPDLNSALEKVE